MSPHLHRHNHWKLKSVWCLLSGIWRLSEDPNAHAGRTICMTQIILFAALLISVSYIHAQEIQTVELSYPGTDQRWTRDYRAVDNKSDELVREKIYHSNNTVWMAANYGTANDPELQEWNWYYDNGNQLWSAFIKNDKLEGLYRHWYENGQPAEMITFKNNVENGPAVFFYDNGQVAAQGFYEDGVMRDFEFFDSLGEPFSGHWEWNMFPVDEIRMRGEVSYGKMTGLWSWTQTGNSGRPNRLSWTETF